MPVLNASQSCAKIFAQNFIQPTLTGAQVRDFIMCKKNDSIKAKALLEEYNLRITLSRVKILLCLRTLKKQLLTVHDIHKELLDSNNPISKSSIHNTLKELMHLGLISNSNESQTMSFILTEHFNSTLREL